MLFSRKFLVIIESPFAGESPEQREIHLEYARRALLHSIQLGEAPLASHLLYPQVLDDHRPTARRAGIECGLAWSYVADFHAFYTDYGISPGMDEARKVCDQIGRRVIYRSIGRIE